MSAAMTPRVRVISICDEATASEDEDGVYSLEGVRYEVYAPEFPYRRSLWVYLLLSSVQPGVFPCSITIVNNAETWSVLYSGFRVGCPEANEPVAIGLNLGEIPFPEPGRYTVRVRFATNEGVGVLKGEQFFFLHHQGE